MKKVKLTIKNSNEVIDVEEEVTTSAANTLLKLLHEYNIKNASFINASIIE